MADMTLTKHDIMLRISEETGLLQIQSLELVQEILDQIAEALAKGDRVELRNFGVFEVKSRRARVGRNPKRPKRDVPIPACSTVKFKAGKELKTRVLALAPNSKAVS